MEIALMAVLVIALCGAVVSFSMMGLRHYWRSKALARHCHEHGLRFSRDDPFDIPHLYGNFALVASGHSPRASNVTHGHIESWHLRAFDFRYELGHGTLRTTRRYCAIVIDGEMNVPEVLMWNDADATDTPLQARQIDGHVGRWSFTGDAALAGCLRNAATSMEQEGFSLQLRGGSLMLYLSVSHRKKWDYTAWLELAIQLASHAKAYRLSRDDAQKPPTSSSGEQTC